MMFIIVVFMYYILGSCLNPISIEHMNFNSINYDSGYSMPYFRVMDIEERKEIKQEKLLRK